MDGNPRYTKHSGCSTTIKSSSTEELNIYFLGEDMKLANRQKGKCTSPIVTQNLGRENIVRMAYVKNSRNKFWLGIWQKENSYSTLEEPLLKVFFFK